MLQHYLKIAFRNLWKYKRQSLISIIGLSVALACFTICFYAIRSLITVDSSYPDSDRMYIVQENNRFAYMPLTGKLAMDTYPEIEDYLTVEFHNEYLFDIGSGDSIRQYHLFFMETNPSFIDFFSYPVVSPLRPDYKEFRNGILLFESTARMLFGREDVVGEKMICYRNVWEENKHVNKGFPYTVVGVVEDLPHISFLSSRWTNKQYGIFINDEQGNLNPDSRNGWTASVSMVKLKEGVSVESFNEKFKTFLPIVENPNFAGMIGNSDGKSPEYSLLPYSQALKNYWGELYYVIVGLLLTIGLLVISVAVVNYVSYISHQFLLKKHECAIRKAMNGNWWQLYFLFYTEILLAILLSGVFAYLWLTLFASEYVDIFMFFTIEQSELLQHLPQYIVLGVIVSFLCCIIPVMRINRLSVSSTIHGGRAINPKSKVRNILLGLQLFISVLFISAAVTVYLQLDYVQSITYSSLSKQEKEHIIEIEMVYRDLFEPHKDAIIDRLKSNPNIESLLLTRSEIADMGATITGLKYEGEYLSFDSIAVLYTDYNYCEFTNTKLLEGHFVEAPGQIVINETARRLLNRDQVLGIVIENYREAFTVVGVIEDEIRLHPDQPMKATFYLPSDETNIIYAKAIHGKRTEVLTFINNLIREFVPPTLEFELNTLDETIDSFSKFERTLFKIILIMSIISIIIGLSGIYSSVHLTTENRKKEVAIRKINGAVISDIIRLFLKAYLLILSIASIPAFVFAYYFTNKWLEVYAFHIEFSCWIYLAVLLLVCALLVATVIFRLLRIANENPADVVKSE